MPPIDAAEANQVMEVSSDLFIVPDLCAMSRVVWITAAGRLGRRSLARAGLCSGVFWSKAV
jgi:hypothetical protein